MRLWEHLRRGSFLDRERVRIYPRLLAGLSLVSLLILFGSSQSGMDRLGHLIGSDFLSFWAVGKLLLENANPYDASTHLAFMREFAPNLEGYPAFFYPPQFLAFCLAFGLFPYFVAYTLWLATTAAAYLAALRAWSRELDLLSPVWVWFAAFPPVLITITHGQTSFLIAALLGGGLLLVAKRPVLAGFLLGLATIKPQFGLLVPLALLLTGSWRTIAAAGITALALAAINGLAFGFDIWRDWLSLSSSAQSAMTSGAIGYGKMVSVFAGLKVLGVSTSLAYSVQIGVSLIVAATVVWASWRKAWSPLIASLVLVGAPLATPFALDYDMALLAFPLIFLAHAGYRDWEKTISLLAFIAPVFARPLAHFGGIPIMPLVLGLLFWILARRSRDVTAS